jgi:cobalamin biosynthesis Mg chelatase CobN
VVGLEELKRPRIDFWPLCLSHPATLLTYGEHAGRAAAMADESEQLSNMKKHTKQLQQQGTPAMHLGTLGAW